MPTTAPRVEGSFLLDGLIEGQLPGDAETPERLREWAGAMKRLGLDVQLELDGGSFSLLANESRSQASRVGPQPAAQIRDLVEQLVGCFPDPTAAALFSTLRSVEIRPGVEVQTVYVVRPDGSVEAPERVLDASTAPPPKPPTAREWVKVGLVSLVLLAALFGVTSLFVDWRGAVESMWNRVVPFDASEVEIVSAFDPYFRVVERERAGGGKVLRLTLERTKAFPKDDDAIRRAFVQLADVSPTDQQVLSALGRGYVRVEIFDENEKFLGFHDVRIAGLRKNEKIEIDVRVPLDPRPASIHLIP